MPTLTSFPSRVALVLSIPLCGLATFASDEAEQIDLWAAKAPNGGVTFTWSGGAPEYQVYRSMDPRAVVTPGALVFETRSTAWTDFTAASPIQFYRVRTQANCL